MKAIIYCDTKTHGVHSFYLMFNGCEYFLFNQNYRKGVQEYFSRGVSLAESTDYSRSHKDSAIIKTMSKIPVYIKYLEKEYAIEVFEQTKKRNSSIYGSSVTKCQAFC